jgi:excisionase family DNA binding protein
MTINKRKRSVPQGAQPGVATTGPFYAVDDIAGMLGVSTRTVRRWIDQKQLAAHKFGRAVRVADSDLRSFLSENRSQ